MEQLLLLFALTRHLIAAQTGASELAPFEQAPILTLYSNPKPNPHPHPNPKPNPYPNPCPCPNTNPCPNPNPKARKDAVLARRRERARLSQGRS